MNLRLGEALIQAGKLTKVQLEETLREQAIFGGKFGTNLIEMGYIEEDELAVFLSQKTGIPSATPEQLMEVTPDVIALLPEEVVRKYRVMPLALNNKRLTLAMADPCDFAAIDEISFRTGFIINPVVTPELRLVCALEKHYNIRRDMRYIRINLQGRRRTPVPPPAPPKGGFVPPPPPAPGGEGISAFPVPEAIPEDSVGPVELVEEQVETHYPLEGVVHALAEAPNRQAIAELVVEYASRHADRAGFFLLKPDRALGWVGRVAARPLPGFQNLQVPLASAPLFARVAEQKTPLLGRLPETPVSRQVKDALGGGTAGEVLVVPLAMTGKVVGMLYLESEAGGLGEKAAELRKLLTKASMAFEVLILKSKILMLP